jgi:hypothetical protein
MTPARLTWVWLSWRETMFWRRLVASLVLAIGPAAICLAKGWGLLALATMVAACWPWRMRASADATGITLYWLFLKETWPASSISRLSVQLDPRRWAWPLRTLLVVERANRRSALLFAPKPVLFELVANARANGA